MARKSGSTPVSQAIDGLLKEMPTGPRLRESTALVYWERVAGPAAALATEAESVRDGILFVRTKSSAWSQELTFYKERLIKDLNRLIGAAAIHDIRFKATGLRRKKRETDDAGQPTAEALEAVVLPPDEQRALDDEIALLRASPDGRLHKALVRHMVTARKLRRWRIEHGWSLCSQCQTPHRTDGDLCPICRIRR